MCAWWGGGRSTHHQTSAAAGRERILGVGNRRAAPRGRCITYTASYKKSKLSLGVNCHFSPYTFLTFSTLITRHRGGGPNPSFGKFAPILNALTILNFFFGFFLICKFGGGGCQKKALLFFFCARCVRKQVLEVLLEKKSLVGSFLSEDDCCSDDGDW